MTHRCLAPGHTEDIPDNLLMCKSQWYRVPKPLRDAVWAVGLGSPELFAAQQAAIESLQPHD